MGSYAWGWPNAIGLLLLHLCGLNLFSFSCSFQWPHPLLLIKPEISILNVYTRKVFRQIMKLHHNTAAPAIHFLSGALPAEAALHIKQFSLLRMIAHLGLVNCLYSIAYHNLTNKVPASWFHTLRATPRRQQFVF